MMADYHKYIIIGAGPAGLQMGYFMEKDDVDYLILEGSDKPGNFFTTQPRHRTLISINKIHNPFPEKEFNMRHDWNSLLSDDDDLRFTKYTKDLFPRAEVLVEYLNDFADKNKLRITFKTWIENVDKVKCAESGEDRFRLRSRDGNVYECGVLLVATGARKDIVPEIPGIELADTYSEHSTDVNDYTGKFVAIFGRGNSAFEVANHLSADAAVIHIFGQEAPKFAWDTHFVGDLRAVNNNVLDMYQLKSLHSYTHFDPRGLRKLENGKIEIDIQTPGLHWDPPVMINTAFDFDKVICCTGFSYVDLDIFSDNCKPATKKEGKYPDLKNNWETENVADMFYMGTAMQAVDRKAASGFIHGFRYNIRTLYHLLKERYHDIPYPSTELERDAMTMSEFVVKRVSITDSLYQMYGFLCDVLIVPEAGDRKPIYFKDLPVDYVFSKEYFTNQKHMFTIILNYTFERHGRFGEIAAKFGTIPNLERTDCQAFLRPIVSYYNKGKYVGEETCNESLILRYDIRNFKGINERLNFNRIANFFNKYTDVSPGVHYDVHICVSEEAYKKTFVPLTEDQKKRLPSEYYEMPDCKTAIMHLTKDGAEK